MINRGLTKDSQYVFNSETGMLEKLDDKASTIESLSKQVNEQVKNLEDIAYNLNKNQTKEPVNNIVVITADDNLIHNYFYDLDVSWDASNCLSSAIIKMPKMDTENTNYWVTYQGQLTIYAGYNFTFDYVNNNKYSSEQDAANSLAKYWDNSDIKPFFRGEISRVKEFENDIKIYVDSIGRRFQQKIPDEFRQAFIYNQNVRDAFQAICEFLGVQYICPPKTSTDDGEEETEDTETSTDGTENDVSSQVQSEKKIASQAKKKVKKAQKKATETAKKKATAAAKKVTSGTSTNNSTSTDGTDTEGEDAEASEEDLTNNEEIEGPQNGYGDINFDANGAIVHGSKIIETSPDMAETLLAMDENPLEKYLEDETGIIEKVKALLDGDMFDEIHNKVMNYDAITIQPKAAASSNMSATGGAVAATGNDATNSTTSNNAAHDSGGAARGSSSTAPKNGWYGGQLYENGKIVLYASYINSLGPAQAKAKAQQTGTYTPDTLRKLRIRAQGVRVR